MPRFTDIRGLILLILAVGVLAVGVAHAVIDGGTNGIPPPGGKSDPENRNDPPPG